VALFQGRQKILVKKKKKKNTNNVDIKKAEAGMPKVRVDIGLNFYLYIPFTRMYNRINLKYAFSQQSLRSKASAVLHAGHQHSSRGMTEDPS
jgi:hypothetical protein